jgi:DNA-binding response OmpR family regulator
MKLLLIEDDPRLAEVVVEALNDYSYVIDVAADGETGLQQAMQEDYRLILLDVMLPKLDGISVCQRLRSQGCQVPILMMTARDATTDKVAGLDAGADDYIIKPVDLPELLARIRALLRRGTVAATSILHWGELCLSPNNYEVTYANQPLRLTPKEFALLQLFLYTGNQRVLSRRTIISHLWSFDDPPSEDSVKAHLKSLRHKLQAAGAPANLIETVRGLGYRLKKID